MHITDCHDCIHYDYCGYFDFYNNSLTEEELFYQHCVGCCCGDGCECNKHNDEGYRCENWEDGSYPIMG